MRRGKLIHQRARLGRKQVDQLTVNDHFLILIWLWAFNKSPNLSLNGAGVNGRVLAVELFDVNEAGVELVEIVRRRGRSGKSRDFLGSRAEQERAQADR